MGTKNTKIPKGVVVPPFSGKSIFEIRLFSSVKSSLRPHFQPRPLPPTPLKMDYMGVPGVFYYPDSNLSLAKFVVNLCGHPQPPPPTKPKIGPAPPLPAPY